MFTSVLQGLSRLFTLGILPLILLASSCTLFFLYPQLISSTFTRLPWLPAICLGIAALIAWQFGRSRLVWLSLVLFFILQTIEPHWPASDSLIFARSSFILVMLGWLMLDIDRGFSLRNLIYSFLILGCAGLVAVWLLPLVTAAPMVQQYVVMPSTSWLFTLWPRFYQWYTPSDVMLILISATIACIMLVIRLTNSQVILVLSWLACLVLLAVAEQTLNQVMVCTLAVIIAYAVIRDSFFMAYKDELTGIPSRRALMQKVDTLGRKYTLVMSDIDHFKKFNDTYGHDVGDEVLKLVASKLSKVSGGGQAFRFGGEEFVLLFANKTPEQVLPHIEAIRCLIADYDIALRSQPRPAKKPGGKPQIAAKNKIVNVTSSFGVAQKSTLYRDFNAVMKQADIALYAAKKAGRNCVKVSK
ncbi:MAG: GGDEF domain-containing protein [Paraglaciecola sp.]|nr:GGDEF domain-containing protein [Paraglaciecola sp.]